MLGVSIVTVVEVVVSWSLLAVAIRVNLLAHVVGVPVQLNETWSPLIQVIVTAQPKDATIESIDLISTLVFNIRLLYEAFV
jgi:hypothetical protein